LTNKTEEKKVTKKKQKREKLTLPQMEFDDALRKILSVKPDRKQKEKK
jgi:hypothetical protein